MKSGLKNFAIGGAILAFLGLMGMGASSNSNSNTHTNLVAPTDAQAQPVDFTPEQETVSANNSSDTETNSNNYNVQTTDQTQVSSGYSGGDKDCADFSSVQRHKRFLKAQEPEIPMGLIVMGMGLLVRRYHERPRSHSPLDL